MAAIERAEAGVSSSESAMSLPSMVVYSSSSFFARYPQSSLPTPTEVRALAALSNGHGLMKDGHTDFSLSRPHPVIIRSLGLFIKYGSKATTAEAQTQDMVYRHLGDRVPSPEVFGWAEDGDQVFIYMALIEGNSLQSRWASMTEDERIPVCRELRAIVSVWKSLDNGEDEDFIGCLGKRPLNDILIRDRPHLKGPYIGADAVRQFHQTCDLEISDDTLIVFTHNDFCPPNILLTPEENPKVAAVVDWGQSGWLPAYWESCKARRVSGPGDELSAEQQEEWWTKYLPMVMAFEDDEEVYHPFIYFQLANI